jgi:hypothetical protein
MMNKDKDHGPAGRLGRCGPEKHESCGNCYFWEHRPEMEMDTNTGFCAQKKAFKSKRSKCKKFCKKGALDTSILLGGPGLEPEDEDELTFYDN